ncbi:CAP domain-containing protein, partial [Mycena leptocephala]
PADVQLYLEIHNVERSEHGAFALVWNDTLADVAQTWAGKCTNKHSGGTLGPFGEYLAAGTGQFNISDALGLWDNEAYNIPLCSFRYLAKLTQPAAQYTAAQPKVSHWTQVVWKATSDLG